MRRKLRIARIILTEIAIMALGVLCCIMPMPWRLIVPIIIGTRSIIIKAHMRLKEPLPETISKSKTKTTKRKKSDAEKKPSKAVKKGDDKKAVRQDGKSKTKKSTKQEGSKKAVRKDS